MIAAVKLLSGVLLVPGPEIMRFFRFGAKAAPSRFRVRKCGLAGTLAARDVGSAALLLAPQMILPRGSSSAYSPAALPRFGPAKRFSVSPLRPATRCGPVAPLRGEALHLSIVPLRPAEAAHLSSAPLRPDEAFQCCSAAAPSVAPLRPAEVAPRCGLAKRCISA